MSDNSHYTSFNLYDCPNINDPMVRFILKDIQNGNITFGSVSIARSTFIKCNKQN